MSSVWRRYCKRRGYEHHLRALYLLTAHAAHVLPSGPVYPDLQRHAEMAVFPVPDVTELIQSVHRALPVAPLYLLTAHAAHVLPSGPVYPELQRHAEIAVFPVPDVTELIQSVHRALPVAPLYLLTAHAAHRCQGVKYCSQRCLNNDFNKHVLRCPMTLPSLMVTETQAAPTSGEGRAQMPTLLQPGGVGDQQSILIDTEEEDLLQSCSPGGEESGGHVLRETTKWPRCFWRSFRIRLLLQRFMAE